MGTRLVVHAIVAAAMIPLAHAQDEFEIQVYDVETAEAGAVGLELHVNEHLFAATSDETHVTFEPHYGLRSWLELGGYFQTSVSTSDTISYAGVKLRAKIRVPRRLWCDRLGLAVNVEVSAVPARYEANVWGSELRPIADLRVGHLYAAVNPIIGVDLAGRVAGHPQLEPAAKVAVIATEDLMFGVEAYGAYGAVDALGDESVERVFAVVDVRGPWWDLDVGIGASRGSPDHPIAKMIFGVHPR